MALPFSIEPEQPTYQVHLREVHDIFNLLLVPKHMSFIYMDTSGCGTAGVRCGHITSQHGAVTPALPFYLREPLHTSVH